MDSMKPTLPGLTGLHMQVQARQPVAPTNCPTDMDDGALRAHGMLHGQSLLPEWRRLQATYAAGDQLRGEANRLTDEANQLHAEANRLHAGGSELRAEGDRLYAESYRLTLGRFTQRIQAYRLWLQAIREHFGYVPIQWDGEACMVAGERYEP